MAISVNICAIYALICIFVALSKGHEKRHPGLTLQLCRNALKKSMSRGNGIDSSYPNYSAYCFFNALKSISLIYLLIS